jgi:integrase
MNSGQAYTLCRLSSRHILKGAAPSRSSDRVLAARPFLARRRASKGRAGAPKPRRTSLPPTVGGRGSPKGYPGPIFTRVDEGLEALYTLAVHTGMRPGELLGLKWEDVDLCEVGASLRVNRALSNGKFAPPKTKWSRRRIDLGAASAAALRAHRKRQLEERMQKAGLWEDQCLVFPSDVGTPLSHHTVVSAFRNFLNRADLPKTTRLYDLRHTAAAILLSRNVHPKYVQELLGHASIALTLDTYSHVLNSMDGGIGGAMDEVLG